MSLGEENANREVKVLVCVIAYCQEKYIRQCLQSIVDQETGSGFEVIVTNGCSTDGSRGIVREFADRYPDMVKPLFHKDNIGALKNFVFVHEYARGEYIAYRYHALFSRCESC